MKKRLSYVLLVLVAFGLLLSAGCFEKTAHYTKGLKDWSEVTFVDGDPYLKEVR